MDHNSCYGCTDCGTSATSVNAGLAHIQNMANERNFEELQFKLYIQEIQQLNPNLREGCLFVDGLYELVCSRLPVQLGMDTTLRGGARDLLTVHNSGVLLLQKYWHRPHNSEEHTAYLTVATSFAHYFLTQFGPRGVSKFLQSLDYSMDDPVSENFHFEGQDILKLEFKWKKYVDSEVVAKFRLSPIGMLHMLFAQYLLIYWPRLLMVFVLMLSDVALEFIFSLAFAELISLGFSHGPLDLADLFTWTGVLVLTLLTRFAVLLVSAAVSVTMAVSVSSQLRRAISHRLGTVTPLFLTDHSPSSLLTTFSQDVTTIERIVSNGLRAISTALILVLVCFIYYLIALWPLALYLIGLFILSQIFTNLVSTRLNIYLFAKGQAASKLCDILKEQIDGFLVNKVYQLSGFWEEQMQEIIHSYYTKQAIKGLFFTNFCWLFQQMVPNVSIATMLFGIILLVHKGYTDFTTGMGLLLFYIRVSVGLTAAASFLPELQNASAAMGRINALLNNRLHEITWNNRANKNYQSATQTLKNLPIKHISSLPIEFRGVCFSYKTSAAHWNLFNVCIKIKAGERVVIVGTTGSGKSTLLLLVMELHKPTLGQVIIGDDSSPLFNGHPKVSATFQSNHMFNTSLRENIRMGNLAATDEEVEEAASEADIHNWIMSLPRGYDTPVQSGGSSLSGGQRQRIAIARMLVAKSPIYLLDEVTSSLDPVTEIRVFEKLMEVTKGRTVLAITHRLEQTKYFDRIVVLSHGRVKEVGSHSGLLAHRGAFWRMWNNDMAVSPGRPVSILRRRMSGELQIGETPLQPELTILPMSSVKQAPMSHNFQTPACLPLYPLIEIEESTHVNSHSKFATSLDSPNAAGPPPPTAHRSLITKSVTLTAIREAADENSEPHPCAPCKASTPIVGQSGAHFHLQRSSRELTDTVLSSGHSPQLNAPTIELAAKEIAQQMLEGSSPQVHCTEDKSDLRNHPFIHAHRNQTFPLQKSEMKCTSVCDTDQTLPLHPQPLRGDLKHIQFTYTATSSALGASTYQHGEVVDLVPSLPSLPL